MPRRLLLALILLLSAQFVWAAVAPYCAHEEARATFHVGHHVHKHGAQQQDATQSVKQIERTADMDHPDCHQCHGSPAQFGTQDIGLPVVLAAPSYLRTAQQTYRSPFHQDIDRPKWPSAA